jgi:hypothetical protein
MAVMFRMEVETNPKLFKFWIDDQLENVIKYPGHFYIDEEQTKMAFTIKKMLEPSERLHKYIYMFMGFITEEKKDTKKDVSIGEVIEFELNPFGIKKGWIKVECSCMNHSYIKKIIMKLEKNIHKHFIVKGIYEDNLENLSKLERGIVEICRDNQGNLPSDKNMIGLLAEKSILNPQNKAYTRTHVTKTRNALVDKGYTECNKGGVK